MTISDVDPEIFCDVAEIVVGPDNNPVASPVELMFATDGDDEVQAADCVMSCDEPSLNVAVAVNCSV